MGGGSYLSENDHNWRVSVLVVTGTSGDETLHPRAAGGTQWMRSNYLFIQNNIVINILLAQLLLLQRTLSVCAPWYSVCELVWDINSSGRGPGPVCCAAAQSAQPEIIMGQCYTACYITLISSSSCDPRKPMKIGLTWRKHPRWMGPISLCKEWWVVSGRTWYQPSCHESREPVIHGRVSHCTMNQWLSVNQWLTQLVTTIHYWATSFYIIIFVSQPHWRTYH